MTTPERARPTVLPQIPAPHSALASDENALAANLAHLVRSWVREIAPVPIGGGANRIPRYLGYLDGKLATDGSGLIYPIPQDNGRTG